MFFSLRQFALLVLLIVGNSILAVPVNAQDNIIKNDWPMFADPVMLHEQKILVVADRLIPTWLAALASEANEIRVDAVETIRMASVKKLPGLEVTIDPLIAICADKENSKVLRHTAASALVLQDAKQAESVFVEAVTAGEFEMSLIVEDALRRWQSEALLDIWRKRIERPTSISLMRLAFNGLASNGSDDDHQQLVDYAVNRANRNSLRLEAAQAIAAYSKRPYLTEAAALSIGTSSDLVIAAALASPTPGEQEQDQAVEINQRLCASLSYVASGLAAQSLIAWNPQSILELSEVLESHRNKRSRLAYVTALYETVASDTLVTLAQYLDDADPELRTQVRNWLIQLAEQPELRPGIIQVTQRSVSSDSWRVQEQGLHMAVELEQTQVALDALGLLTSERAEVLVTAAWALRRLQVTATLAPALAYCDGRKLEFLGEKLPRDLEFSINEQFAHLYQMFGQMKYKPASKLLQQFTRKEQALRFRVRASAAWALGKIWEGDLTGDPEVAKLLFTRLTDEAPIPPEDVLVKRMCAIGLARMGSNTPETIAALHKYREQTMRSGEPGFNSLHTGASWALTELTGESFPDPIPEDYNEGPWLLSPFDAKLLKNSN